MATITATSDQSSWVNVTSLLIGDTVQSRIDLRYGVIITPDNLVPVVVQGTVVVSNGSAFVVGTNTVFTVDFAPGSIILFGGSLIQYRVQSVGDDMHLTLTQVYSGVSTSSPPAPQTLCLKIAPGIIPVTPSALPSTPSTNNVKVSWSSGLPPISIVDTKTLQLVSRGNVGA